MYLQQYYKKLDEWVACKGGDATHIVMVPGHQDVTALPPGSAPRVLHQPVVPIPKPLATLGAVAHHQHSVVQVLLLARPLPVHSWHKQQVIK